MQTPDVVVLVPGFLGFTRFGGFYYFADRLIAAIRGLLEEALPYPVPVVPCTTLPTDSLAKRQTHLLEYLRLVCGQAGKHALSGVERIHLVGHSTGGVDVQLLTCTEPLAGGRWTPSTDDVRRRIATVVTISAPHYGTCLADSWLAAWADKPLFRWAVPVRDAVRMAWHLLRLVPQEAHVIAQLQVAHPKDIVNFLREVAFHRELIGDLRPAHMESIRATREPDPRVSLTCFVGGTPLRSDGDRRSDSFFTDMYGLTSGDGSVTPALGCCESLLKRLIATRSDFVIRSPRSQTPTAFDGTLNDGVVNSIRQVVNPDKGDEVGGFVVADHADVLGHYDRQDALIAGKPYNAGLFHSGAGFGDDEFFALYRRVARAILKTIPK